MTDDEAKGMEHAWRYFALHAEQRMTVFNFFVASAGLALTGLAWTLADGSRRWPLGAAAGVAAAALSVVFGRLDQRGSQLVKVAEDAIAALEGNGDARAAVVTTERGLAKNGSLFGRSTSWTFGRSFRLLFRTIFWAGLAGAAITTWIGTGPHNAAGRPSEPRTERAATDGGRAVPTPAAAGGRATPPAAAPTVAPSAASRSIAAPPISSEGVSTRVRRPVG